MNFLTKIFDSNEKEIKRLQTITTEINALEPAMQKLKIEDFPKKTTQLKERVAAGESLDALLPEAFALVREATVRSLGMRHFDEQIMGGIVLSEGKIAEQKTGEGKTLTAVLPLYLHALTGKGVHLVTVNDYLARLGAGWVGPIFDLLGMKVSAMINNASFVFDVNYENPSVKDFRLARLKPIERKEAYAVDVTYGINSEFGFDYLRDNMAQDKAQLVQRGYYYAIVDEVDSVLIDEARTPHIISAPDEVPTDKYYQYAQIVDKLVPDTDFTLDEKQRSAHLTERGLTKIEKLFGITEIYEKDFDTVYHLEAALKARALFHKEKDYIVRDNQVILVDEFTGRLMEGRRLSEGLHQALEAKENVTIQRESKTLATVSLQNYFRMYTHLAGMTGTATTEAEEFHKIYKLDVVAIPTHNPVQREDMPDIIYKTERAKFAAVVREVEEAHAKGQPVLIGTTSIERNEILSQFLKRKGIVHELLNAKNHEREAQIIAKAGEKGAVTVATNMAGRGVDIILGGDVPKLEDGNVEPESKEYKEWQKKHDEVVQLGGLYVIGTERHESRRIDNQLRGRSGRQGDPGKSQFFVSLSDDVMRLFGGDSIANMMTRLNMPEDTPLSHNLVSRAIEQAQMKVEGYNFDVRKYVVEYDDVLNKQREIIYKKRNSVLLTEDKEELHTLVHDALHGALSLVLMQVQESDADDMNAKIMNELVTIIPFDPTSQQQILTQLMQLRTFEEKESFLTQLLTDVFTKHETDLGETAVPIYRFVFLKAIDDLWMDHLTTMEALREGVRLRGYGQKDPLVEYKNEGFTLFERLMNSIDDTVAHTVFKIRMDVNPFQQMPQGMPEKETEKIASTAKKTKEKEKKSGDKPGRNDPCWCGSGKKYKKCHFPN